MSIYLDVICKTRLCCIRESQTQVHLPDQRRCFQCPSREVHPQTVSGLFSSGPAFEVQHSGPIVIFGDDLILNILQM